MIESHFENVPVDPTDGPALDDCEQTTGDLLPWSIVVAFLVAIALFLAIPAVEYLGRFDGIDNAGTTAMIVAPLGFALVGAGYSVYSILRRQAKTAIWTMLGAIGLVVLAGLMTIFASLEGR